MKTPGPKNSYYVQIYTYFNTHRIINIITTLNLELKVFPIPKQIIVVLNSKARSIMRRKNETAGWYFQWNVVNPTAGET